MVGTNISEDVYKNIFLYGIEAHRGQGLSGDIWLVEAQTIDLRSIKKITTMRVPDKNRNYYKIILSIKGGYLSTKYSQAFNNDPKIEPLEQLQILISDNREAAIKIKKAFIDLGSKLGININDGDYY